MGKLNTSVTAGLGRNRFLNNQWPGVSSIGLNISSIYSNGDVIRSTLHFAALYDKQEFRMRRKKSKQQTPKNSLYHPLVILLG